MRLLRRTWKGLQVSGFIETFAFLYEFNITCAAVHCPFFYCLMMTGPLTVSLISYVSTFIPQSVLRLVHSLFHSDFSIECDTVFPASIFYFLQGYLGAAYVFFLVFPFLICPFQFATFLSGSICLYQ